MRPIVFFFLFSLNLNAQEPLDKVSDFKRVIYSFLDSLQVKNHKYSCIRAIAIFADSDGKLDSFSIVFSSEEVTLSKRDYKWLFKLLKSVDYKQYEVIGMYSDDIPSEKKDIKLFVRYVPRELRRW